MKLQEIILTEAFKISTAKKKINGILKNLAGDNSDSHYEWKTKNDKVMVLELWQYTKHDGVDLNPDLVDDAYKKLKNTKWLEKMFDISKPKYSETDDTPDGGDTVIVYYNITLTPKDNANIAYEDLEDDLKKLSKDALEALKASLKNPKELSKLITSVLKEK